MAVRTCAGVAPSRGRGSKQQLQHREPRDVLVAPSRGRGSKLALGRLAVVRSGVAPSRGRGSKLRPGDPVAAYGCRSLTGARIETRRGTAPARPGRVAPSRGRGSKLPPHAQPRGLRRSLPHGGADRNIWLAMDPPASKKSLPHGGADRNHRGREPGRLLDQVSPSRGRGSKHRRPARPAVGRASLPHGGADRNHMQLAIDLPGPGRSLTGARIETARQ